ncbi:DUF3450 domain-containing protein [Thalassotalea sp. HSM 43]|uniref:DUF3450 domain-containing protein n=1 Tax=Thalassotalea sp. HSM 43 TaxID=2552945 RepID=UPI0010821E9E|nr:DUF3450 domain-containing protein [Thalassotalea sp. HSM 43]QBY03001.1 DUF3450 domain-containing protein [Thalassotalea sp. HSM 43]
MKFSKSVLASVVLGGSLFATAGIAADQQLKQVVKAGEEINQSAEQSQQRINKVNQDIQSKLQQFKAINKEVAGLDIYNGQMQRQINSQVEELVELQESMQQVSVIERQISPLMSRMIATLEQFVALDVPFLVEERTQRVANLKEMMDRADVAVSEKFRRVLEAYQVETDYGRTIEAYTGMLDIDGNESNVDFLRIGRVSLIYQTRDGSQMGLWNQETRRWDELPQSMRTDINKGLRIARKQLAPDLIVVPMQSAK